MIPFITDKQRFKEVIFATSSQTKFTPWAVEKDYYLTVILNNIQTLSKDQIVLKGGVALNKIHLNNSRLSYDLDFAFYTHENLGLRAIRVKSIALIRNKLNEFLSTLQLKSKNPQGKELMGSHVYLFYIQYHSCVTGKEESIKIEIVLHKTPLKNSNYTSIKQLTYTPIHGVDLIPSNKILSVSLNQLVSEKLFAALKLGRPLPNRVRDYYDLWQIAQSGFNFYNTEFIESFQKMIFDYGHYGNYRQNFGLSKREVSALDKHAKEYLLPFIRHDEKFELNEVYQKFNTILSNQKFDWMHKKQPWLIFKKTMVIARDYLNL